MKYNLTGEIKINKKICGNINVSYSGSLVPPYNGEYKVIPKSKSQLLKTQGFRMEDNVLVSEIPISVVENQFKGNTVYIG